MTLQSFFIGLALSAFGFSMVYKTEWYLGFMGLNEWAENKFGGGGTRLMYKLIGCGLCFFGILALTGQLNDLVGGVAGSVFGARLNK